MIRREFRIFLTAIMFFTRIPCPNWVEHSSEYLAKSPRYLPLVGWIVGLAGALVIWIGNLLLPLPLTILLSTGATILLTGAFHEDGFIDVCDAFGGGWTKDQILTIMKDSCVGAFGVIGIVILLAIKLLCLTSLSLSILPIALIVGHSLSRFVSVSLMYTHDYVREDLSSKSKPVVCRITFGELLIAAVFGITPLILLSLLLRFPPLAEPELPLPQLWIPVLCLLTVWIARWYLGRYFTRWINGYTGDCLGAVQQVTEVVFYLTLVSMG